MRQRPDEVAAAVLAHADILGERHAAACAETLLLATAGCFAHSHAPVRRCLRDVEGACLAHHAMWHADADAWRDLALKAKRARRGAWLAWLCGLLTRRPARTKSRGL